MHAERSSQTKAAHRSRAAGLPLQQRAYLIGTAVEDHGYVVRNPAPNMVLLSEIFRWSGEFQGQLKEYGEAFESYRKSRELKPDYWPAYAGHADLLTSVGQRGEARTVLEQGLAIMPTELALRSRLGRLGSAAAQCAAAPEADRKSKPAQGDTASTDEPSRDIAPAPK